MATAPRSQGVADADETHNAGPSFIELAGGRGLSKAHGFSFGRTAHIDQQAGASLRQPPALQAAPPTPALFVHSDWAGPLVYAAGAGRAESSSKCGHKVLVVKEVPACATHSMAF